jgi:hypothetical protein
MTPQLHDHILTRLTSTGADQHPWSLLILAALDGPQALADYFGGSRAITPPARPRGKATRTWSADADLGAGVVTPGPEAHGMTAAYEASHRLRMGTANRLSSMRVAAVPS